MDSSQDRCCPCWDFRSGTIACAVFTLVTRIILLIAAAALLGTAHAHIRDVNILFLVDIQYGVIIGDAVLLILFSIMLIYGVTEKNKYLFYPWMIYVIIELTMFFGGLILFFISGMFIQGCGAIIGLVLYSYLYYCVFRYYKQLFTVQTVGYILPSHSSPGMLPPGPSEMNKYPPNPNQVVHITSPPPPYNMGYQ